MPRARRLVPTAPLPTGTLTFLFTDIEGSTRLWEAHPDAMHQAVARHDTLVRQNIEARGGFVFKTVGDAFCAAFGTTRGVGSGSGSLCLREGASTRRRQRLSMKYMTTSFACWDSLSYITRQAAMLTRGRRCRRWSRRTQTAAPIKSRRDTPVAGRPIFASSGWIAHITNTIRAWPR